MSDQPNPPFADEPETGDAVVDLDIAAFLPDGVVLGDSEPGDAPDDSTDGEPASDGDDEISETSEFTDGDVSGEPTEAASEVSQADLTADASVDVDDAAPAGTDAEAEVDLDEDPDPAGFGGPEAPDEQPIDTAILERIEGELADVDAALAAIDAGDLTASPLLRNLLD